MDSANVLALIDELPGHRVAVIGDAIADEFVYGRVARVSREAPVLILEYDSTDVVPGGAGNAANNVAAGNTAGTRTILVRTGHGAHEEAMPPGHTRPDAILNNLMEAVGWILRTSSR